MVQPVLLTAALGLVGADSDEWAAGKAAVQTGSNPGAPRSYSNILGWPNPVQHETSPPVAPVL